MHDDGLELVGEDGVHNLPRRSKCDYYFGQRIVGWSRVAQVCIMELIAPHVENIVCGDTDSLKVVLKESELGNVEEALAYHARCLDRAKFAVTARVRRCYPAFYSALDGIGHYVLDGEYEAFSAGWNKAYIALGNGKCHVTLAGIPTSRRADGFGSYDDFCNDLMGQGATFDDVAALAIGYNVTIDHTITKLNVRLHPRFGEMVKADVEDHLGKVCEVRAPAALALFPGSKTIGDTQTPENARNSKIAIENNPKINLAPVWLRWEGGKPVIERGWQ